MNKINIILSAACAVAIINNSFGMLTKTSSIKQIKKIKAASIKASYKAQERKVLNKANQEAKVNNELLHKIIQQNEDNNKLLKENNALLRDVIQQNNLLSCHVGNTTALYEIIHFNKMLEEKYNIKIYE